jgi:hypothetical protein
MNSWNGIYTLQNTKEAEELTTLGLQILNMTEYGAYLGDLLVATEVGPR